MKLQLSLRAMKINNARAHYVTPAKVVGSSVCWFCWHSSDGWKCCVRSRRQSPWLSWCWRKQSIQIEQQTKTAAAHAVLFSPAAAKSAFDINATRHELFCVWTTALALWGLPAWLFSPMCASGFFILSRLSKEPIVRRNLRTMGF